MFDMDKRCFPFRGIVFLMLALLLSLDMSGQDDTKSTLIHILETTAIPGAELTRNTGDFKLAYGGRYTASFFLHKKIGIGAGTAINVFERERLVPLFGDVRYRTSNRSEVAAQMGYSFGFHKDFSQVEGVDYKGGYFMEMGYVRRFPIKENIGMRFSIGARFQNIRMDIADNIFTITPDRLNYLLLTLRFGIDLR